MPLKIRMWKLAEQIARRDDEIDALFDQVRRELITIMIEEPKKDNWRTTSDFCCKIS